MIMYNNDIKIIKCSIPEVSISTKYEWTIKINKKNITNTKIPFDIGLRRTGDPDRLVNCSHKASEKLGWSPQFSEIGRAHV